MDAAGEKSSRGQHHRPRPNLDAEPGDHAGYAVVLHDEIVDGLLQHEQARLILDDAADRRAIQRPVGLGPGRPHRGALACVEHAEMDAGPVHGKRHGAAERVDLPHEVTLADAADRRVARHLPDGFDVVGDQQRARALPRRSQGGLGPGMSAADHDHIEIVAVTHGFGLEFNRRRIITAMNTCIYV